ncbi:MAG TPA: P1 family peptidase [Anaerolineales bacterium]|nr:P1 family peptidase [Anaerolineales bacterium]
MDRIIAGGNEGNYRRLFAASVFATEEAIINSMVAAEDMTGHRAFR